MEVDVEGRKGRGGHRTSLIILKKEQNSEYFPETEFLFLMFNLIILGINKATIRDPIL